MNQEKFQTGAIVFLVFAVNLLMYMIWQQNVAIGNLTRAVNQLSGGAPRIVVPDTTVTPQPAPAPAP